VVDDDLPQMVEVTGEMQGELRGAWHRYVDLTAPLRPSLQGYCRRLTGNLWDAEDLVQETLLMLDGGQVENVGSSIEFGRDQFPREDGWFEKAVYGHPEWPAEFQYEAARMERALYEGEPIALGLVVRRGREALEQVLRIEERDGGIARLRGYAFCPETIREIGAALGMRVRTGLYRYPTPTPGQ